MQGIPLTVTDLNEYVRRMIAGDPILRSIQLRGEVSNFKQHVSGHWYFSLKDEQSRIACALFRQNTLRVRFSPRDGMRVILTGTVGLYTQGGTYQFYAEGMTQDGMGELFLRFEQLKERLSREGLFDVSRKRSLPFLPRSVGIVTSRTGAVLHDIMQVTQRRFPGMQLVLRPAQVQGNGAAQDIAAGIAEISAHPGIDVVIVGRGGGSIEDLWAFNEEIVVRAIATCPVPVISAVGHETDVTLSDFAADVRAPTPSAAAELAVPHKETLLQTLMDFDNSLRNAVMAVILARQARLARTEKALQVMNPVMRLQSAFHRLATSEEKLQVLWQKMLVDLKGKLRLFSDKLSALGPRQALQRGYAIVLSAGAPVTSAAIAEGDLQLLLNDGRVNVRTISIEMGDPFGFEQEES